MNTQDERGKTGRQRTDTSAWGTPKGVYGEMDIETRPVREFRVAQRRLLDRFGIRARSRFVYVPAIGGRAHVLETGDGPPVVMVIGGMIPAAMWVPLMPQLNGFRLFAVDLPGFGLTNATDFETRSIRPLAVEFLDQVLRGLDLERAPFITQSMGSLWTTWLAVDRPDRVAAMVQVGCTAFILGTSAPLPMRLLSVPPLGRVMLSLRSPSPKQVDGMAAMVKEDFSETPELRDVLLACEKLPSYGQTLVGLMHATLHLRGARSAVALTEGQLARITQPVQMIWGAQDPFGSPEVGERAAGIIPVSELHIVPGGHAPWFRYADQVGALTAPFLRRFSADRMGQVSTVS